MRPAGPLQGDFSARPRPGPGPGPGLGPRPGLGPGSFPRWPQSSPGPFQGVGLSSTEGTDSRRPSRSSSSEDRKTAADTGARTAPRAEAGQAGPSWASSSQCHPPPSSRAPPPPRPRPLPLPRPFSITSLSSDNDNEGYGHREYSLDYGPMMEDSS